MHHTTSRPRHHAPRALALSATLHGLLAAVWLFAPAPARDVNAGAMTVEVLAEAPKPPQPASAPPPTPEPTQPEPAKPKAKPAPTPDAKAKLPRMAAPKPSATTTAARPSPGAVTTTTVATNDGPAQPVSTSTTPAATADAAAEAAPAAAARGVDRDDYRRMVWTRIMRFRPPQVPFPGTTRLRFTLNDSGELVDLFVADSSGSGLLDRAALDAVRRAAPFPPPPDLAAEDLRFEIPFHFR